MEPQTRECRLEHVREPCREDGAEQRDAEHPAHLARRVRHRRAEPGRCGPTAFITAAVIGDIVAPIP